MKTTRDYLFDLIRNTPWTTPPSGRKRASDIGNRRSLQGFGGSDKKSWQVGGLLASSLTLVWWSRHKHECPTKPALRICFNRSSHFVTIACEASEVYSLVKGGLGSPWRKGQGEKEKCTTRHGSSSTLASLAESRGSRVVKIASSVLSMSLVNIDERGRLTCSHTRQQLMSAAPQLQERCHNPDEQFPESPPCISCSRTLTKLSLTSAIRPCHKKKECRT